MRLQGDLISCACCLPGQIKINRQVFFTIHLLCFSIDGTYVTLIGAGMVAHLVTQVIGEQALCGYSGSV